MSGRAHREQQFRANSGHSGKGVEGPQRKSKLFFDRKQLHSTLGCNSLMQLLGNWLITQQDEKLVA
ncbi:hypothetical protein [Nitrosospira lacus]|uniref:hypothetical protein n=1 Tax=Nitrosospira lacus TaxID=1288494 RepID=UPI0002C53EF8|nr:hypothetical protein [Nitrosospira lacus]